MPARKPEECDTLLGEAINRGDLETAVAFEGAWRRVARARAQVPRSAARRVPVSGWLA